MKYFHRNYFFLLIASALTKVLWSLTYTTTRYRTRFSLMMAIDGTPETVSYTHLDVYKRQTIQYTMQQMLHRPDEQIIDNTLLCRPTRIYKPNAYVYFEH